MPSNRLRVITAHMAAAGRPITTHVLDTATGRPAANLPVALERIQDGKPFSPEEGANAWEVLGSAKTNNDGRVSADADWFTGELTPATYRMTFNTGAYFEDIGVKGFYPIAQVVFVIEDLESHYHVPLLLSPFGFSTYRGS
eukprot:TRINITY_DN8901_c0_g1_i1.p1 TRINITY_DN8901_c0_g1~~TRINITY_DN8901_c0_g1_i1.p1  ORF type:complete len:141 (+),score=29.58 TRINITY_DN8901_c0_g1_i1:168-590(+)